MHSFTSLFRDKRKIQSDEEEQSQAREIPLIITHNNNSNNNNNGTLTTRRCRSYFRLNVENILNLGEIRCNFREESEHKS